MARYMRSDLGRGHSKLGPPIVVTPEATIAWYGPGVRLATPSEVSGRILRRGAHSVLRPPRVVTEAAAPPLVTRLNINLTPQDAWARRRDTPPRTFVPGLRPPVVVFLAVEIYGPEVHLRPSRRPIVKSHLGPPIVVFPFFARKPEINLARIKPPPTISYLSPPEVVGPSIVFPGLRLRLTTPGEIENRIRRAARSILGPPVVVQRPPVGGLRITLARTKVKRPLSDLAGPVVVAAQEPPLGGTLIQYVRRPTPKTIARLSPPAVVRSGATGHLGVILVRSHGGKTRSTFIFPYVVFVEEAFGYVAIQYVRRPRTFTKSKLSAPAVTTVVQEIYYAPQVTLAAQRRRNVNSTLFAPRVVRVAVEIYGPQTSLAPSFRGQTSPVLRGPVLVEVAPAVSYVIRTTLAPSFRGQTNPSLHGPVVVVAAEVAVTYVNRYVLAPSTRGKAKSHLSAPVVIGAGVVFPGLRIKLTFGKHGVPKSKLRPPAVVDPFRLALGPELHLTPSRRPKTKSVLRPPTVVFQIVYSGPSISLAPSRRLVAKSQLLSPAVIGAGIVFPGLRIKLTFGKRGVAKSKLSTPALVTPIVAAFYGPQITLVRIRPRLAHPALSAPAVVSPDVAFDGPGVLLTRSFRGQTYPVLRGPVLVIAAAAEFSFGPETRPVRIRPAATVALLKPPVVVSPILFSGPATELAPSFRGQPTSFLKPPTAVNQPPAYMQVIPPTLTYSRRGRPIYFLAPPTVVFPFFARKIDITLAPQARGKTKLFRRPEIVVPRAIEIYGPKVTIAPAKRGKPTSFLSPPALIGSGIVFPGLRVKLAFGKRGVAKSTLFPPAVVTFEPFRGILTWLAPSSRGQAFQFQIPPIVGEIGSLGPQIHLTRIKPPPVLSLLKPPTVVGAGIAFFGPEVHLVRIKPPRVIHFVIDAVVEQPFVPEQGDVCGYDISESFICFIELPSTKVFGGDQSDTNIESTTASESKISGGDMASGKAFGGDQEAN